MITQDQQLLELKPFRTFRVGEIVAISTSAVSSGSEEKNSEANFIYATVIEIGEIGEGGLRKISLKISENFSKSPSVTLFNTEIYSFRSARESAAIHSNQNYANNKSTKGSFVSVNLKNRIGAVGEFNEVPHKSSEGIIASTDIMSALGGLLNRAGVPVSLENQVDSWQNRYRQLIESCRS